MHIRVLTAQDAASFVAVRLRGLLECPEAFASSYDEERSTPLTQIEARLGATADAALLGAFERGALIAVVGVQRESLVKLSHKAFIWGMYVVPEARRQGVGQQLLRRALEHAADVLGVRQVNLGVNTSNLAAVALYRRLGFVAYGLERGFLLLDGVLHDEHQMVCQVARVA